MNFHPNKQFFQVAGAKDRTTDPWITKPALYLYTMEDPINPTYQTGGQIMPNALLHAPPP